MSMDQQIVVVIGGSSGIGYEVARQTRAQGARLIIIGRHPAVSSQPPSAWMGNLMLSWRERTWHGSPANCEKIDTASANVC
jgi:NAD(P)-dependent dehydrogenase (short-subunit alcohol dehydrogenase family)